MPQPKFSPSLTRRSASRKWSVPLRKIAYTALITISSVCLYLLYQNFFSISNIECKAQNGSCSAPVTELLTSYLHKPLLILNTNSLEPQLFDLSHAESIQLEKKYPNTLKVLLKYSSIQYPIMFLKTILPDSPWDDFEKLVTQYPQTLFKAKIILPNGTIQDATSTSDIFTIVSSDSDSELMKVFNFIHEISQQSIEFRKIFIIASNAIVYLSEQRIAIIDIQKPPTESFTSLQHILSTATIKDSRVIDLRYNNPIIKQ